MTGRKPDAQQRITSEQYAQMAVQGDLKAFEALMLRHEKGIYNLAYTKTYDPDDAFDISQETFLRAYKSLSTFRGDSSFSTWLYRICINVITDHQKKKGIRQKHETPLEYTDSDGSDVAIELPDNTYNPEQIAMDKERSAMVRREIDKLNEKYRVPLVMRDIGGLSYNKISEVLNLELGTVKSRIKRARENLKALLEKSELFK